MQLEERTGLFPSNDDESTVTAEVDAAIQRDVNLAGLHEDIGESMNLGKDASAWEKQTAADINAMSRGAISKIHADEDSDALTQKFAADVKEAKARLAKPKKTASKESQIEHQADEALKDPQVAAQLKKDAEKAEVDLESALPSAPLEFFQEDSGSDELGEDDEDEDGAGAGMQLMSGSQADVEKAINAQITEQVNQQIGSIPTNTGDADSMKKFEQDKIQAEKFLDARKMKRQKAASDQIKAQLLAAQKELTQAQATTAEADESEGKEETKEAKEESKAY